MARKTTSELIESLGKTLQSVSYSQRGDIWRLDAGRNKFYVVPSADDEIAIAIRQHSYIRTGNYGFQAIDLGWVMKAAQSHIFDALQQRFGFSDEDMQLVDKYGDPFSLVFKHLKAQGKQKLYKDARPGQTRALIHTVQDGEYKILETSVTTLKNIYSILEEMPNMIDEAEGFPLVIKGEGEGMDRSYSAPIALTNKGPAEVGDNSNKVSLFDTINQRVVSYKRKTAYLIMYYMDLVKAAGLTYADFGVTKDEIKREISIIKENKEKYSNDKDDEEEDDGAYEENNDEIIDIEEEESTEENIEKDVEEDEDDLDDLEELIAEETNDEEDDEDEEDDIINFEDDEKTMEDDLEDLLADI